ncbi:hypothetical protein K7G42_07035 [Streptococcus parauberis]|uniref:Uncharacterized protein n=1 Tax=Streptococcus parauberis KRS-02083 TaxID=1207545 RepID=A0ABN0IS97_9STRE|nr:hypothetical protein [Streptococcus parauberis]EMG25742.1 hypothetical protein SPJ1_1153 [Streptococcus parauberis KRS-02083]QBX27465.1 hypothetical protein Javan392_0009 [Streptococcus phage Javan392]WEM64340.1 hypothetical protein P1T45_06755 [Streptococcus parauberis]WOF46167.1 hypothetical protein K7G42_07035 [Streptococcus parauberis]
MELTTLELTNIEAKFMNIFERLEILEQKEPTAVTVDSEKFAFALSNVTQKSKGIEINRK